MLSPASHLTGAQTRGPHTMPMAQIQPSLYNWKAKDSFYIINGWKKSKDKPHNRCFTVCRTLHWSLHLLAHLIVTTIYEVGVSPHFIDEETEASGWVLCVVRDHTVTGSSVGIQTQSLLKSRACILQLLPIWKGISTMKVVYRWQKRDVFNMSWWVPGRQSHCVSEEQRQPS